MNRPTLALALALTVVCAVAALGQDAANLIPNPSAEEVRGKTPLHWSAFTSFGRGPLKWGSVAAEGREGLCAFVEVPEPAPRKNKKYVSVGLVPGARYSPQAALDAKPLTTYSLSFLARGDVPRGFVFVRGWTSGEKNAKRQYIPCLVKPLVKSDEWTRYEGRFTTLADTRKFVVVFNLAGYDTDGMAKGQRFYLDDVRVAALDNYQPPRVRVGDMEKVVLDPMEADTISAAWRVSPGMTRSVCAESPKEGRACMRVRFDFESKSCAGWPGVERTVAFLPSDWRGFDRFEFWIRVSTPTGKLPGGISLKLPPVSGKRAYRTTLAAKDLRLGQWVKISIPVPKILNSQGIRALRLHVARSAFLKARSLTLDLDEVSLTRSAKPNVVGLRPVVTAFATSARALAARIEIHGLASDQPAPVELRLLKGDRVLVTRKTQATKGSRRLVVTRFKTVGEQTREVVLDLAGVKLVPGDDYVLTARVDRPKAAVVRSAPLKVVGGDLLD